MRKNRLFLSSMLFGGMAFVLFAMLAFITARNAARDKAAIMQNALAHGYWIVRSLEIGHSLLLENHTEAMRGIFKEIKKHALVHSLVIVNDKRQVLLASDTTREGTRWPDELGNPPEHGRVLRSDLRTTDLVFPAFFAEVLQRIAAHHPHHDSSLDHAKWIILTLDTADAHARYRASVLQSVLVSLGTLIVGLAAFFFLGIIQRYQLASASLATLENIKRDLARFVPGTVQKLIEANPGQPMLAKVAHEATILFLDIDQYTRISEDMAPEALNRLIETYFSVFLDIILSHGGEINETAGDSIMAIFTGKTPRTHALNAVRAAVAIREQVRALNQKKTLDAPEILVNIGINTGQVLLGATMIKGTVGEHFTYTASGMVTNIASRLCDLGNQGEIHLSSATAQLVMNHVTLDGPLETHLKNVRGMLQVYKLD